MTIYIQSSILPQLHFRCMAIGASWNTAFRTRSDRDINARISARTLFDERGLCHRVVTHALPYIHVSSLRPLVPVSIARQFKSEADRLVGMGLG
jgi:hypothetical protein